MARVRRPRYLCFFWDDHPFLDIGCLLRGTAEPSSFRQILALSILVGEEVPITSDEFDLVVSTPSDRWVESGEADQAMVHRLAQKGVLLSDEDDDELATLRQRDAELERTQWNLHGALYYLLTKWRGVDLRRLAEQDEAADLLPPTPEVVREFLERYGRPPRAFHSPPTPLAVHELPLVARRGALYDILVRRRTTRSFDLATPLRLDELAIVLDHVFGYHGYAPLFGEVTSLKRTSPSGGALHPVEAYPLVRDVEGVEAGLYHYNARDHALELVAPLTPDEAGSVATAFVCGQTYFSAAHVLFVLTARFDRAFWKYRRHQKGLASVLMDAAHLSQTLYLVATDLGLGAFVTVAVNSADIEERLGLDGVREGVVAVCGCGKPAREPSPFDPAFLPYVPRETALPG